MTSTVPKPRRRLALWRKLTEPPAHITDPMARQQARMLALTILLVLPLLIGAIIARLWMGTPRPNLWIGVLGLGFSYGLLRTRWWRIAPLLAVITALLLPVSTFFAPPSEPIAVGVIVLVWYIICLWMIFVLYGTRLASLGALLTYCISMAIYPWFHPGETTYVLFVTILYVGVFLSLQTIAYVRSENENELQQTLREVHDARRLAEALTEMTAILSSTLDLEEVLDRILQQIAGIVPSSSSDIMLIENGVARIVRLRGFQTRGIEQQVLDLRFPLSQFANLRQMIASGETILIEDTAAHPEWVPIPVVDWIRAELSAPIRLEGETIGFLNLSDERPGAFTPAQARLLTTFAVQAAIAIRNARLFDETRRYATDLEKEVNERTAQLHLTHTRLRAILDATGEGIFYTEGAYIQYANAAMAALTGYTQQELIGKTLDSLRDPGLNTGELQQIRAMPLMIWKHGVWRGETRLVRKDGTTFYAGLTVSPMGNRGQAALRSVTLLRDISLERELALQKSQFVAHASHELRTPITNLKTRLYLLRKRPETLPEQLPVLEEVAERMKRLVEDLLDRTRLERGLINVRFQPLDLVNLLRRVADLQRPEAEQKGLTLTFAVDSPPIMVSADGERLIQVFTNLVTNAINYTVKGGITVSLRVIDGRAHVDIQDSGVGIASEHLPHIFEPFYRVVSDVAGTGLGLSLVQQIVTLHNGEIQVTSQPGKGSCFTVSLQLAPGAAALPEDDPPNVVDSGLG